MNSLNFITIEIATAQKKDHQIYSKESENINSGFCFQLIEDTVVL